MCCGPYKHHKCSDRCIVPVDLSDAEAEAQLVDCFWDPPMYLDILHDPWEEHPRNLMYAIGPQLRYIQTLISTHVGSGQATWPKPRSLKLSAAPLTAPGRG
jgi:hypothetical protein